MFHPEADRLVYFPLQPHSLNAVASQLTLFHLLFNLWNFLCLLFFTQKLEWSFQGFYQVSLKHLMPAYHSQNGIRSCHYSPQQCPDLTCSGLNKCTFYYSSMLTVLLGSSPSPITELPNQDLCTFWSFYQEMFRSLKLSSNICLLGNDFPDHMPHNTPSHDCASVLYTALIRIGVRGPCLSIQSYYLPLRAMSYTSPYLTTSTSGGHHLRCGLEKVLPWPPSEDAVVIVIRFLNGDYTRS
jgi:hypothetical protein